MSEQQEAEQQDGPTTTVYLNQAVAGVGEKDQAVEVDEAYGRNLIDAGLADAIEDPDEAPAVRPQPEVPLVTHEGPGGPIQVPEVDPHLGIGAAGTLQPDDLTDDEAPDPEAPKREQAAWADAHGVQYPKSATGERIAQAIAEHLAGGEDADEEAEADADEDDGE